MDLGVRDCRKMRFFKGFESGSLPRGNVTATEKWGGLSGVRNVVSHKVVFKSFYKSQFPHKSVNLVFT